MNFVVKNVQPEPLIQVETDGQLLIELPRREAHKLMVLLMSALGYTEENFIGVHNWRPDAAKSAFETFYRYREYAPLAIRQGE